MEKKSTQISLLIKGSIFAATKHYHQTRKDECKTPYIKHPEDVMNILWKCGVTDVAILIAALLHDTIEDTKTTAEEIVKEFGEEICKIVLECSDDKGKSKIQRKELQIIHAKVISWKAKLVKMADKLSNLKDLFENPPKNWSDAEKFGYAVWAYFVFSGLKLSETEKEAANGVNEQLEKDLLLIFSKYGILDLKEDELNKHLQEYYKNIDNSD